MTPSGTPDAVCRSAVQCFARGVDGYWNKVSTATSITFTVENGANASFAPGTQPLAGGEAIWSSMILKTAKSSPGWQMTATAGVLSNPTTSIYMIVNPSSATKLLMLLPTETYDPGTATGKAGSISNALTTDSTFTVTVMATDNNWNIVTTTNPTVQVVTSDIYDSTPSAFSLSQGSATVQVNMHTAGRWTLTASTTAGPSVLPYTSPSVDIGTGSPVRLQILVSPEIALPCSPTGKTSVEIALSLPAHYSLSRSTSPTSTGTATQDSTRSSPFGAGSVRYPKHPTAAKHRRRIPAVGGWQCFTENQTLTRTAITVATNTGANYLPNTSAKIPTDAGLPLKIVVLAPGEQLLEGSPTGKISTMTPVMQIAGSTFPITVYATDQDYNVNQTTSKVITISFDEPSPYNDPYAVAPATLSLAGGTTGFNIVLYNAENKETKVKATGALSHCTVFVHCCHPAQSRRVQQVSGAGAAQVQDADVLHDYGSSTGGKTAEYHYADCGGSLGLPSVLWILLEPHYRPVAHHRRVLRGRI